MFKGFIKISAEKRALEKFKDVEPEDLRTLAQCSKLRSYAGVLAEDTVLVDIDDQAQAEILLKIVEEKDVRCQVRQTDHGMHFYFKNDGTWTKCSTHAKNAIGLTCDIKLGCRNSYAILQLDDRPRAIIYDIYEDEEYEPVPYWLKLVSSKLDMTKAQEGDGRNTKLYSYILPLQGAGFTKEQTLNILQIINEYVFEKSLSQEEFTVATRDEAFPAPDQKNSAFFEGKTFLFDEFAKHLVDNLHIKRINGQLHVYSEGIYIDGFKAIESEMIKLIPSLSAAKRMEVNKYLDILVTDDSKACEARYIAFKNGIYDIVEDKLMPFSEDYIITNLIDYNFNPGAYNNVVDYSLDRLACNDEQIRALLEECAGYTFYKRNELRKAFILTGDKSNGKSTFLAMLRTMLGENNVSTLDLKELDERFKTAEIYRKLANIGDDIDDDFISNTAIFKKLVSGDAITAERKGQDPFNFVNYAKLIFSANSLPRTKDKTGAVLDRLIIIPFNATFNKDAADYDPFIKDKLITDGAIEYLIQLGVKALRRVLTNQEFTKSEKVEAQREEYNELNNPILEFFADITKEELLKDTVDNWYEKYAIFCIGQNLQQLSRIEFSRQISRNFKDVYIERRRVDGKRVKFPVSQM